MFVFMSDVFFNVFTRLFGGLFLRCLGCLAVSYVDSALMVASRWVSFGDE